MSVCRTERKNSNVVKWKESWLSIQGPFLCYSVGIENFRLNHRRSNVTGMPEGGKVGELILWLVVSGELPYPLVVGTLNLFRISKIIVTHQERFL